jgi:hypothetical protein
MDCVNNEASITHSKLGKEHFSHKTKANWIGHILCRNCLLSHIIYGKIIRTRQGRRCKQGPVALLLT